MASAFQDYYKCASSFGDIGIAGDLSDEAGYFKFQELTCYGRCAGVPPAAGPRSTLHDVSSVTAKSGRLCLPFDLTEVVENLRQERYQRHAVHYVERVTAGRAARVAYYFVRPLLSVSVRRHLQKIRLRGWETIPFPAWPVDFTVETLMERALALQLRARGEAEMPFIWFWPDGASAAAILTHDVEHEAGRDFCSALMDMDDVHGMKASFQIVPDLRYPDSTDTRAEIRQRGFEVNVHDLNHDGHLYADRETFLRRAAEINRYAREFESTGFRAAAMYRDQAWYSALEFDYDMSVPNVAHLEPQRGGCCTVMPYFVGNLVELPLTTVQDYSVFHILGDYSTSLWRTQIDMILSRHGLVTLLTHPDYLIEERARRVYLELLAHVAQLRDSHRLWFALPREVAAWWRLRSQMSLVRARGSWRAVGPGSERARVAVARLRGDRVEYQVESAAVQTV
jgi:hypothetical protein